MFLRNFKAISLRWREPGGWLERICWCCSFVWQGAPHTHPFLSINWVKSHFPAWDLLSQHPVCTWYKYYWLCLVFLMSTSEGNFYPPFKSLNRLQALTSPKLGKWGVTLFGVWLVVNACVCQSGLERLGVFFQTVYVHPNTAWHMANRFNFYLSLVLQQRWREEKQNKTKCSVSSCYGHNLAKGFWENLSCFYLLLYHLVLLLKTQRLTT